MNKSKQTIDKKIGLEQNSDENLVDLITHCYQNYGVVRDASSKIALLSLISIPIFSFLGYFGVVKFFTCLFGFGILCFFSDYPLYILIRKMRK